MNSSQLNPLSPPSPLFFPPSLFFGGRAVPSALAGAVRARGCPLPVLGTAAPRFGVIKTLI